MPYYASNEDLPRPVRELLPGHGLDICRKAFNSAWERYASPSERRNPKESREEVARKVAWAAVKRVYEKGPGGEWRRKGGGESLGRAPGACPGERSSGTTHPTTIIFQ
ncbi:MAG: ChaB family protein [Methanoculleus marisnigri]|nr:ChaB family protein [Methanoculleus marisnigri]